MQEIQKRECTFAPSINASSRRLAPDRCLEDLVTDDRGRRARLDILERRQEEERKSCTFTPTLCKGTRTMYKSEPGGRGRDVSLSLTRDTFIDPALILKADHFRRQVKVTNGNEGDGGKSSCLESECTFHPLVFPYRNRRKEPILVNGLNRHLQLQSMAVQKTNDIEERKRLAFQPDYSQFRDEENITIVQPFHLTQRRSFHS